MSSTKNFPRQKIPINESNIFTRNFKNLHKDNFVNEFNNQSWSEIINIERNDVDYSFQEYMANINNVLDSHIPLKKISAKQFKQRFKPWITNDIQKKIKEKNEILRKCHKERDALRKNELRFHEDLFWKFQ